jgi:CheY-like chemotaxis protein
VELMGGSIGVFSETGCGSTFWIELDMPESTAEVVDESDDRIISNDDDINDKKHIVYVEDNFSSLVLMKEIIDQMTNYDLKTAENGEQGLELILNNMPDIALLDINLPDMSGYEILEKLRKHPQTSKMRIIAISANAMPSDIENGISAGFDNYLCKPIKMEELLQSIA